MIHKFILWWPPIVALIGLVLTGTIAIRRVQQRRDLGHVLGILSLGLQLVVTFHGAALVASTCALVATSAPMPWSVRMIVLFPFPHFLIRQVPGVVALTWILWAVAVVATLHDRARQWRNGLLESSWSRRALRLLGVFAALIGLGRFDERMDDTLGKEWQALHEGRSTIEFRAQTTPETVEALERAVVRQVQFALSESGWASGLAVDAQGRAWRWDPFAPWTSAVAVPLPGPALMTRGCQGGLCALRADGHAFCASMSPGLQTADLWPGKFITAIDSTTECRQSHHVCALSVEGAIRCWTEGHHGGLEEALTPLGPDVRAMTVAFGCAGCVVYDKGSVECWAEITEPFLGMQGDSARWPGRSCIEKPGGGLRCWQRSGEIEGVHDALSLASAVEAPRACAITRGTGVHCWELNGTRLRAREMVSPTETYLADRHVDQVAVGPSHICAISESKVYCWGDNSWGQLCDGTTTNQATPVMARGITDAVSIAAEGAQTCIVRATGSVACCGSRKRFGSP